MVWDVLSHPHGRDAELSLGRAPAPSGCQLPSPEPGANSSLGAPRVKAQYGTKATSSVRERSVIAQIKVRICILFLSRS